MEINTENGAVCSCTYEPCVRKHKCCECLPYHMKREELPACFFSKEVEKTYDRSFLAFARMVMERSGEKS